MFYELNFSGHDLVFVIQTELTIMNILSSYGEDSIGKPRMDIN
jgi:hypothetical protein